jgi:uncharacterized alkaline shock family protein YloU
VGDPDADAIAAAALACSGVAGLHGGPLNDVAAYLPGRTVRGVRLAQGWVEVHVVGRYGTNLPAVAEEVRAAVTPAAGGLPVEVHIDDLDIEPALLADAGEVPRG